MEVYKSAPESHNEKEPIHTFDWEGMHEWVRCLQAVI